MLVLGANLSTSFRGDLSATEHVDQGDEIGNHSRTHDSGPRGDGRTKGDESTEDPRELKRRLQSSEDPAARALRSLALDDRVECNLCAARCNPKDGHQYARGDDREISSDDHGNDPSNDERQGDDAFLSQPPLHDRGEQRTGERSGGRRSHKKSEPYPPEGLAAHGERKVQNEEFALTRGRSPGASSGSIAPFTTSEERESTSTAKAMGKR